jgi:membrane protease YdiL (CAAX protease family)
LKQDLREPIVLTALLLAYSNGLTVLANRRGRDPERSFLFANPAMLIAMLAYAASRPGGLPAAGVRTEALGKSALLGMGAGGLLSILPLAFFRNPVLLDTPLEYGPVVKMTAGDLLKDVGLRVPVNIACLEELAFRGILYDSLRVRFSERAAIAGSACAFACWHFAVTYVTATGQTNIAGARLPTFLKPFLPLLVVLGTLLSTGFAGVVFAYLRKRTGNLAAPVVAHWVVDGLMIGALWRSARRSGR